MEISVVWYGLPRMDDKTPSFIKSLRKWGVKIKVNEIPSY